MTALVRALVAAALADPVAEEVVVYDTLERWDHTAWLVQVEQRFPTGTTLETSAGTLVATDWQLELVLRCERARGGWGLPVGTCAVSDAAVRATTRDRWQRAVDREDAQRVLDATRAALIGAELEIGVSASGGARLIRARLGDLPLGIPTTHTAERLADQAIRPFHFPQPPEGFVDGEVWTSGASAVMDFPDSVDARQLTEVAHFGDHFEGVYVVQSVGRAAARVLLGVPVVETPFEVERGGSDFDDPHRPEAEADSGFSLSSVAVFDLGRGWMTERVWAVGGEHLHQAGRLRLLRPDERPALGATEQISPPGRPRPHLARWAPVSP